MLVRIFFQSSSLLVSTINSTLCLTHTGVALPMTDLSLILEEYLSDNVKEYLSDLLEEYLSDFL